ncbi:hypothetical protein SBX64_08345 [Vibrio rhizosphaerae]|uniref:Uncharacterized protein n=1 Tax=Vibrio rhizosphaerae TaxID=398736 RepID=A0ABU4IWG3_9VIBR|nr:hypothetical protein [Vibrio rhizosphaerae]MDW6092553.1 hypothetical protein [Vibrio rhizosphaerae]
MPDSLWVKNINFGDVLLMRCKLLLLIFCGALSFHSLAQSWDNYLKNQMIASYSVLENKMEYCDSIEEKLPRIDEQWFIQLSKKEKYAVASYLAYLADMNCFGEEQKQYESAMLAYTAESKDENVLKEWFSSARVYRGAEFEKTFANIDVTKLLNWHQQNSGLKPFDIVQFLQQYPEFQQH